LLGGLGHGDSLKNEENRVRRASFWEEKARWVVRVPVVLFCGDGR
jgi:hypothetical protein